MRVTLIFLAAVSVVADVSAISALADRFPNQTTGSSSGPVIAGQPQGASAAPAQTIRLEPMEGGRVRLHLEGLETWTIEARSFDVVPTEQGIRFVAQPLDIAVRTANVDSVAGEFELTVSPAGVLGFQIKNLLRRIP